MPPRSPADDRSRYLKVLSDPERLKIVEHLRGGPKSVGALSRELNNRIANVSHHLGLLRQAGIVVAKKQGRFVIYQLSAEVLTGDGAASLDFGCCRVDLDGGHAPPGTAAAAAAADDALRQINRIVSRRTGVTRRAEKRPPRGGSAGGAEIAVENSSFEKPTTAFFDTAVQGWRKEGDPSATGVFFNAPDDAVFRGSRFVNNADGNQLAAISARRPEPPAAAAALYQVLGACFRRGTTYELSMAVGISSVQPPTGTPPPVLLLALTYADEDDRRHEVSGLAIPGKGLRAERLARHALRVTIPSRSAPMTGRPIGILITTAPNGPGHDGHFVFDDVRLVTTGESPRPHNGKLVSQRSNGR